jgi:hypothetical protein
MRRFRRLLVSVSTVLGLFAAGCSPDENARQELVSFRAKLDKDSTRDLIEVRLKEFPRLSLAKVSDSHWVVRTPLVYPARNWVLHLTFNEEGRIRSGKVRIFDSETMKPEAGPPDLSFP